MLIFRLCAYVLNLCEGKPEREGRMKEEQTLLTCLNIELREVVYTHDQSNKTIPQAGASVYVVKHRKQ
jgi:hypothetical protein